MKRVCLVGQPAGAGEVGGQEEARRVVTLVQQQASGFAAREKVERVRNGSKVERGLVVEIVARVAALCLAEEG
jgi:hypothetical protein